MHVRTRSHSQIQPTTATPPILSSDTLFLSPTISSCHPFTFPSSFPSQMPQNLSLRSQPFVQNVATSFLVVDDAHHLPLPFFETYSDLPQTSLTARATILVTSHASQSFTAQLLAAASGIMTTIITPNNHLSISPSPPNSLFCPPCLPYSLFALYHLTSQLPLYISYTSSPNPSNPNLNPLSQAPTPHTQPSPNP